MQRREFLASAIAASALIGTSAAAEPRAERIRIAQIGTGHGHASGKMATMRKFNDLFDVVGIAEPDAELRRRNEGNSAYDNLKWMDVETLLATPGLQAVAVETEVKHLVPTALRCVQAGMHVHLDKPAGESLSDFKTLLETARTKQRLVQMGYMFRYNPAFRFMYQAVRENWLGPIFEVHAVMSKQLADGARRELSEYPGGSMFELGCHLIDSLTTLMGRPERITPYARTTHPERDSLVDNQLAVFEYPAATATIRSSMLEPFGGDRRHFTVCGEAGTIEIDPLEPPRLRMALLKPRDGYQRGWQDVALPKPAGRYDDEFRAFARMIRGELAPEWSADHDLLVHESVLQASSLPVA